MSKIKTFYRYFKDFIQYGQFRLVIASVVYLIFKKSFIGTRLYRGKLGYFLHRKGSLDFQFGNYAYEWAVKVFIGDHYKNYTHFLDIGANVGTYSVYVGKFGLKTYAFEPVYDNWKALNINLMLNNLERKVKAFNYGLSDVVTEAAFDFDPLNTGASHLSTIDPDDEACVQRSLPTTVTLVTLDQIRNELDIKPESPVLVKIDVEGMERQVLNGARKFIQEQTSLLFVIESIHTGEANLKNTLDEIAVFEYYPIDALNFAAKKIRNH
ncbi:MAG: FkbM family methyltransferase [Bacteroidetes bacterium]|nr:FkbM family methyltransferase [Bacteroidota bacterium]